MLIGLNGQLGVGKDTVFERALHVCARSDNFSFTPERLAFADAVKTAVCALLEIDVDLLERAKRDPAFSVSFTGPRLPLTEYRALQWLNALPGMKRTYSESSMRRVIQRFGSEVGRVQFGAQFWVDQCLPLDFCHQGRCVIVTDCRYPNEVQRVHDLGGHVVRVVSGPSSPETHSSERVLPDGLVDFVIDNSIQGDDFASLDATVESLLLACESISSVGV